jgi:hypothetical protein
MPSDRVPPGLGARLAVRRLSAGAASQTRASASQRAQLPQVSGQVPGLTVGADDRLTLPGVQPDSSAPPGLAPPERVWHHYAVPSDTGPISRALIWVSVVVVATGGVLALIGGYWPAVVLAALSVGLSALLLVMNRRHARP